MSYICFRGIWRRAYCIMENLPKHDVPMLVSAINFLLRDDEFDNLDQICDYYHEDRTELEAKLAAAGFKYSEEQKRII